MLYLDPTHILIHGHNRHQDLLQEADRQRLVKAGMARAAESAQPAASPHAGRFQRSPVRSFKAKPAPAKGSLPGPHTTS